MLEIDAVGISVDESEDRTVTVAAVIGEEPDTQAGFRVGDQILKVDGASVLDGGAQAIVTRIGARAQGTEIVFEVFRPSESRALAVTAIKDAIKYTEHSRGAVKNAGEGATWKCGSCGNLVEESLGACWSCRTERPKVQFTEDFSAPPAEPVGTTRAERRSGDVLGAQLGIRYKDAYRVVRITILFGGVAKAAAFVFGIISVVFALVVYQLSGALALLGGLFGVFAGFLLYVVGVLVAGHGQLLLTSIDQVINTSPFLTNAERAAIMRVGLEEAGELR